MKNTPYPLHRLGIVLALMLAIFFMGAYFFDSFFVRTDTQTPPTQYDYTLYFSDTKQDPEFADCSLVAPVVRSTTNPVTVEYVMRMLSAGPTPAEQAEGLISYFSLKTQGIIGDVRVIDGTYVVVDLVNPFEYDTFSNNSASCAGSAFLAQLTATAQSMIPDATLVVTINGSAPDFYEFMQIGCSEENENCFEEMLR